ncbi:MAG TPA: hypothetical protein VKR56_01445 [Candidatus Cybelea sp.]|nr:hypothetical protein [Candidatus Cybelea sp.]
MRTTHVLGPLIAMILAAPGIAFASPTEQRVSVSAYGCPFTGAKTVAISMQNTSLFGLEGRTVHVPVVVTPGGALHFEFRAPPGPIYIDYSIDGQWCTDGGEGLVVLPGHDRNILIAMYPKLNVRDWHARKFVAGVLPGVPVGVSVVVSDSPDCPSDESPAIAATIDGGAYYAGYAYGRHLFLKLVSAGFDRLYIALPDAVPVESNDEYVRRDITAVDLRRLTVHGTNQAVQRVQSPSGSSTRFP